MGESILRRNEPKVIYNYSGVTPFGRILFFSFVLFMIFFPFCSGKDIIGLAETGSGKTGAFALPVLQTLLENPQRLYALVLTPTRFVLALC